MFNAPRPSPEELPSDAQLRRSTAIAAVAGVALLVGAVLPAEYGIDPTGAGRALGLTEMGEIKRELAEEEERDRALHGDEPSSSLLDRMFGAVIGAAQAQTPEEWTDEVVFTLEPGAYTEVKLAMEAGTTARYYWRAEGGRINFDLHAHGAGQSVTYEKGRGKTWGTGDFTTPFAGDHGWYWRNRDQTPVTVTLRLAGAYDAIRRD